MRQSLLFFLAVASVPSYTNNTTLVYADEVKHLLNNNYLIIQDDDQELVLADIDAVVTALEDLSAEELEPLELYIQQLEAHELDSDNGIENELELTRRNKLKKVCSLFVKNKTITNNLTVCNNAKFNNVIINGTFIACGVNICSVISSFTSFISSGTSADIPLTLVLRDSTGSFAATTITLTGCLVLTDALNNIAGTVCANTHALIVAPQGSRALQTTSQGNVRGTNAVDLQINSNNTQVASGNYAGILSGIGNTASGNYSTVTGGYNNTASGIGSVVAGGGTDGTIFAGNTAAGNASVVVGGLNNQTFSTAPYSGILSGSGNTAQAVDTVVVGGYGNKATAAGAFVGGGGTDGTIYAGNTASGIASVVGGGIKNIASGGYSGILSGSGNTVSGTYSAIIGGFHNTVSGAGSVIGGGGTDGTIYAGNTVAGSASFIGGGINNSIDVNSPYSGLMSGSGNMILASSFAVLTGGLSNTIKNSAPYAVIGGGSNNTVTAAYGAILGGQSHTVSGVGSAIVGGGYNGSIIAGNTIAAPASFIGGGMANTIGSSAAYSAILGGTSNSISGASNYAVIAGGINNQIINAPQAFAAGSNVLITATGAFGWADANSGILTVSVVNSFNIRCSGGARIYTNAAATTGVSLAANGGSWSSLSDMNLKRNITPANTISILDTLCTVTTYTWSFISQDPSIIHIGPMAQDLYAAFGFGEDPRYINTTDAIGILTASVQGLYQLYQEEQPITKKIFDTQQYAIDELEERIKRLEDMVKHEL